MTRKTGGGRGTGNEETPPPAFAPEHKLREYELRDDTTVPFPPVAVEYPVDWISLRHDALDSTNHSCRMCGASFTDHTLHIQYYAHPDEGGYGIENIIVWCSECAGDRAATADRNVLSAHDTTHRTPTNQTSTSQDTSGVRGGVGVTGEVNGRVRRVVNRGRSRFETWAAAIANDVLLTLIVLAVTTARLAWWGVTTTLAAGAVGGVVAAALVTPWYAALTVACLFGLVVARSIARTSSVLPLETVTTNTEGEDGGENSEPDVTDSQANTGSYGVPDRFVYEALALRVTVTVD